MFRKDCADAIYDERSKTLVLYNDNAPKIEEREIHGKVYINHEEGIVRLYNFSKKELSNKEKVEVLYSLLEESVLFPRSITTKEVVNIGEYVLLLNGYLLDGSFKEPRVRYSSIITELIDNTEHYEGEPETITNLRNEVRKYYELYKEKFGKTKIILPLSNSNLIQGYKDIVNLATMLRVYLRDKGHSVHIYEKRNGLRKNKEIHIYPRNWPIDY